MALCCFRCLPFGKRRAFARGPRARATIVRSPQYYRRLAPRRRFAHWMRLLREVALPSGLISLLRELQTRSPAPPSNHPDLSRRLEPRRNRQSTSKSNRSRRFPRGCPRAAPSTAPTTAHCEVVAPTQRPTPDATPARRAARNGTMASPTKKPVLLDVNVKRAMPASPPKIAMKLAGRALAPEDGAAVVCEKWRSRGGPPRRRARGEEV